MVIRVLRDSFTKYCRMNFLTLSKFRGVMPTLRKLPLPPPLLSTPLRLHASEYGCYRCILRRIIALDVYTYMGFDGLIRIMSSGQANEKRWKTDNGNPVVCTMVTEWRNGARFPDPPTRAPAGLDKMVFHCCAYRMYQRWYIRILRKRFNILPWRLERIRKLFRSHKSMHII